MPLSLHKILVKAGVVVPAQLPIFGDGFQTTGLCRAPSINTYLNPDDVSGSAADPKPADVVDLEKTWLMPSEDERRGRDRNVVK